MRDIDANALVRLNLVKQISALGQFQRKPYPCVVLAVSHEAYDVGVVAQILVQGDLQLDLLGLQAAYSEGMVFVYEFDRDDGSRCGQGNGFADAVWSRNGISQAVGVRLQVGVRRTRRRRRSRWSWIRCGRGGRWAEERLATTCARVVLAICLDLTQGWMRSDRNARTPGGAPILCIC